MVPFLPCISMFINIYLMMKLSLETWIRFFVWLSVGLIIYVSYGIRNSSERGREETDRQSSSSNSYGATNNE